MTQFVEKDAALAETVILGLLQYWPTTNSAKCVLYLGELEELLELTQPQEFLNICGPLFRTISRCLMSPHFQVRSSSPQLSRCLLFSFAGSRPVSYTVQKVLVQKVVQKVLVVE